MQEVISRGKRLDNGEWVYGVFWKPRNYILRHDCSLDLPVQVDPKTVGQYIGLKDKNGVKAFTGDIVQNRGKFWQREVYFSTENLQFRLREMTDHWLKKDDSCFGHSAQDIEAFEYEIVGNIYDGERKLQDGQQRNSRN